MLKVFTKANLQTRKNLYDGYQWVGSSRDIMKGLEKVGIKFHISGIENFKSLDTPAIFIGNHMSVLETLPSMFDKNVQKMELMKRQQIQLELEK